MQFIDKTLGTLLFDRLHEYIREDKLSPKERIPKYRSILDDLFKTLVSDSRSLLSGLHARTSYIFREHQIPVIVRNQCNSLRVFANSVVHESGLMPDQTSDMKSAYQLSEVLGYFSKLKVPEKIFAYYSARIEDFQRPVVFVKETKPKYDFFAVVEDVYFPDGESAGKFVILTCSTDSLGLIKLQIWNNQNENGFGCNLAEFGKIVCKYSNIYVTEAEPARGLEDDYHTTEKSYVILEPDYLVDAKELSECRQSSTEAIGKYADNPLLYIVSRFSRGTITGAMMIGNIVGRILDDIVTQKDAYSYKKTFESVMRENSFGMLCIANETGSYDRIKLEAVFEEARSHEKVIREIIGGFRDGRLVLEPTFISDKYGLKGRLDLLIDYAPSGNTKDIVELKSSKRYPTRVYNLYHNHEAQTLVYDLLLKSTFPDRIGTSHILYSSAPSEEMPLRSIHSERFIPVQDLLMLRNTVVSNDFKFSRGEFDALFNIMADDSKKYPVYMRAQFEAIQNTLNYLDQTIKPYFLGFLQFLYRELQIAKIGSTNLFAKSNGFADLWKASRAEKIQNYDVLVDLEITNITDDFHMTLRIENDLFNNDVRVSSFRNGDMAILYHTPDREFLNPLKSQILNCRVVNTQNDSIEISLINKQLDKNYFEPRKFWALERDMNESSTKQLLNLLYEFIGSGEKIRALALGLTRPEFEVASSLDRNGLDEVQYENVVNAIRAKDYYLIQGPPGTGKTSRVLVEIVRNLSLRDEAIMVVAFTNRAVDEICERLIALGITCIRLGKSDKDYSWSGLSARLKLNELNDEVKNKKVFVSTISSFAVNLDILKFKKFGTLVVDEASQVLEPQVAGLLKHFSKWILIGDENQLPAVVLQSEEESQCADPLLKEISLSNFRDSLFYRLKKNAIRKSWDECFGSLRYQYRMHADISEFPRINFYNNQLDEADASQHTPLVPTGQYEDMTIYPVFTKSRIVFIPTMADLRAKINIEEAILVQAMLKYIVRVEGNAFDPGKSVGIITPFRAQIANIRRILGDEFRDVTVDTVERFQGSERRIIIVSFAVRNISQLGALQSVNEEGVDRKLNVAITRAEDHLILMGCEEILGSSKIFRQLISHIRSKGGYMTNPLKKTDETSDLF